MIPSFSLAISLNIPSLITFRSKIAESLNINRTGKQCRERYNNHLRPEIKKGEWSEDEDQILLSMNELYGNKWTLIAQYLPGRSGNN